MKIAITSTGQQLEASVDPRFGRARWLIIYDTENDTYEAIDNSKNLNAQQGAGIQTASLVVQKGVRLVLTADYRERKRQNRQNYSNRSICFYCQVAGAGRLRC